MFHRGKEAAAVQVLDERQRVTPLTPVKGAIVETPTHLLGWLPFVWSRVLFSGSTGPKAGNARSLTLLLILSGVLLYPCMSFYLFEPDEGRYAQIPREMLERGEWIVPTLQGEPYLDKPPLFYWLVMLSYSLFGYSDAAARLVPALAMHGSVMIGYLLGRRIIGERSAFWGTLLLIVSPIFLGVGRLLTLDGVLTTWVTLGVLAAYLAQCRNSEPEAQARDATESLACASGSTHLLRVGWWSIASMACALGVLTKGPVALLLIVPPLVVQRWLVRDAARISWRAWLAFMGIVLALNLPWYVAVCVERPEFVRYFLWQHNVQRFVEPFDHVRPVWFYVPIVLYALIPITFLALPVWRFLTSTHVTDSVKRCAGMGYFLIAGAWCVLFFSMAGSKLPTYILPAFPPLCLALGCVVARTHLHRSRWLIGMITAACLLQACSSYVFIPLYARYRSPMADFEAMRERCGDPTAPVVCFPRHVDSVAFYVGRSDFRDYRSKEIEALIEDLRKQPRTVVLFGHRNSPETLARYLPANLRMLERRKMGLCESAVIVRMAPTGSSGDAGAKRGTDQIFSASR
jgi:4-amino-4-deoxy-L-arabinose transferase-like glycosyltransferase